MRYSQHAKDQMVARNVSEQIVEEVFKWPHSTVPAHSGRRNYFKTIGGFKYRLTVAPDGTIVTVWKEQA